MTIKDIIVGLAVWAERDPGRDYAVDLANHFNSHITGAAYAIEPPLTVGMIGEVPADLFSDYRAKAKRAAEAAVAEFKKQATRSGVHAISIVEEATVDQATAGFCKLARTRDLSI